jgi:hypothetical protein
MSILSEVQLMIAAAAGDYRLAKVQWPGFAVRANGIVHFMHN